MSTQSQGKGGHWLAVILCTLTAGLLARAAIIGDPGLRVPPVIAYIAAAIFLMGALAVLKRKCDILANGAARRGRADEALRYRQLASVYG